MTEISHLRTRHSLISAHLLIVIVKRILVRSLPDDAIISAVYKGLPAIFKVLYGLLDMEFL